MKKWLIITIAGVLIAVVAVASFFALMQPNQQSVADRETLFQVAVWNSFIEGNYSGFFPYSELAKHGDFGIGTVDGLDGEMLCLDGIFYQITSQGEVKQIEPSVEAPYATVTYFDADKTQTIAGLNYTDLKNYIDNSLNDKEAIYAIKVTGTFQYVQARAPAKQIQPYPILTVALQNQTIWTYQNISGTAIGFWFPYTLAGVDYTGYHLHIISDDRIVGGHILDCIITNATVQIDQTNKYQLTLP